MMHRVEPLEADIMNPAIAYRIGAFWAALAVLAGAYGTLWLKTKVVNGQFDSNLLDQYMAGVVYHFFHALAIVAVACSGGIVWQRHMVRWAVVAWSLGIVMCSGGLYLTALTGRQIVSGFVPFGIAAFLVGWALAAIGAHYYVISSPSQRETLPRDVIPPTNRHVSRGI